MTSTAPTVTPYGVKVGAVAFSVVGAPCGLLWASVGFCGLLWGGRVPVGVFHRRVLLTCRPCVVVCGQPSVASLRARSDGKTFEPSTPAPCAPPSPCKAHQSADWFACGRGVGAHGAPRRGQLKSLTAAVWRRARQGRPLYQPLPVVSLSLSICSRDARSRKALTLSPCLSACRFSSSL